MDSKILLQIFVNYKILKCRRIVSIIPYMGITDCSVLSLCLFLSSPPLVVCEDHPFVSLKLLKA
jgi:hypothetical protein